MFTLAKLKKKKADNEGNFKGGLVAEGDCGPQLHI